MKSYIENDPPEARMPHRMLQPSISFSLRFFLLSDCLIASSSLSTGTPRRTHSRQQRASLHDYTFAASSGLTRILALLHLGNHELKTLLHVLVVPRAGFSPGTFEFCSESTAVFGSDLALFWAEIGLVAYDDKGDPFDSLRIGAVRNGKTGWRECQGEVTHKVIQNLVADDACHFEALLAGNRVDNHVAMDANEVLRIEDAVFILVNSSRVSRVLINSLSRTVHIRKSTRAIGVVVLMQHGGRWRWGVRAATRCGERGKVMYLPSRIDNLCCKVLVLIPDHLAESILNGWIVAVDKVAVDELHRETRLACAQLHQLLVQEACEGQWAGHSPTALLPTMAIFLCLGAGILLLAFCEGREEAARLASVKTRGGCPPLRGRRCLRCVWTCRFSQCS